LELGCAADVALLDDQLRVVATVVAGEVVFDPEGRSTWRS
jgi:N-acetylglucosamine-6-phosphate deacetylase